MNKIENYLGIANHDIQMANNSDELKSYVASLLCEIDKLQQENKQLKEKVNKLELLIESLELGVTLNQEQEDLLDKVLFGGDNNE